MKQYTNLAFFLAYLSFAFFMYIVIAITISLIGGHGLRDVLCSEYQLPAMIPYACMPIPVMLDMKKTNERNASRRESIARLVGGPVR